MQHTIERFAVRNWIKSNIWIQSEIFRKRTLAACVSTFFMKIVDRLKVEMTKDTVS